MIKRVYQFADIPLSIGNQAVHFPQNTSWAGDIGSYTHNYKRYATSHRFVHQPTVITFEGDLIYDGSFLPAHIEQKLRSYVGITDTLIIYTLPNDYPPQFDLCKPCETCIDCEVVWLSSPAVLTSVDVSGDADNGFKINLSFTLMDFFYPLNKLIWSYDGNHVQDYDSRELAPTVEEIIDLLNCYPRCNDLFTDCISCRFFSRKNYNTIDSVYNPDTWEAFANDECCDYRYLYAENFETMRLLNNSTSLNGSSDFEGDSKIFNIDSRKWGALPSSIYAFKGMTTNGRYKASCYRASANSKLVIENTYNFGTVTKTERTEVLGFGGVDEETILVVGNVSYYDSTLDKLFRPVMYYDIATQSVYDVHLAVTYPSFAPGQLYPSRNKVRVFTEFDWELIPDCEGGSSWTQGYLGYAYIHLFRRV